MSATIADALMALTPTAQWTLADPTDYNTCVWYSPSIAQPTQAQINNEIAVLNSSQPLVDCKNQASKLLYETDWTTIPDVADPINNPYLMNQAAFITYRNALRKLAVSPVANPTWPVKPNEQWSN